VERAEKTELVATLNQVFKSTGVIVVAHNKGLTANQVLDLRNKMAQAGATVKVAKKENGLIQFTVVRTLSEPNSPRLAHSKNPASAVPPGQTGQKPQPASPAARMKQSKKHSPFKNVPNILKVKNVLDFLVSAFYRKL